MSTAHHARLFIAPSQLFNTPDDSVEIRSILLERFTIDDARALAAEAMQSPAYGSHRRFCISCTSMTVEAQNALLKLFEDPPVTAQFELLVPKLDLLIPTLRSRLELVAEDAHATDAGAIAREFLALTPGAQIDLIAIRTKEKDSAWTKALLDGLEEEATRAKNTEACKALVFLRQYDGLPGASHKMLLEHATLTMMS